MDGRRVHSKGDDLSIYDIPVTTISGEPTTLEPLRGKAVLVVNVASKCGATPQYTALEQLQKQYGDQGFSVVGFPCNQFMGQEPGTSEEIATFCSTTYGVTFPLFEKVEVNGEHRHPVYAELTKAADADPSDGLLDVTIVRPAGRLRLLRLLPRVYKGTHASVEQVSMFRVRRARLSSPGVTAYADGDPIGVLPLVIEVEPGALSLFAPDP